MKKHIAVITTLLILTAIITVLILAALFAVGTIASTGNVTKSLSYSNIKITLDGAAITPKDANGNVVEPFIIDGTTYLPVRAIADALGLGVKWDDANKTVELTKPKTNVDTANDPEKVILIEPLVSAKRNGNAKFKIKGVPGYKYNCSVEYDTVMSTAQGLVEKTADSNGIVEWSWKIGSNTHTESDPVVRVSYNGKIILQFTFKVV